MMTGCHERFQRRDRREETNKNYRERLWRWMDNFKYNLPLSYIQVHIVYYSKYTILTTQCISHHIIIIHLLYFRSDTTHLLLVR